QQQLGRSAVGRPQSQFLSLASASNAAAGEDEGGGAFSLCFACFYRPSALFLKSFPCRYFAMRLVANFPANIMRRVHRASRIFLFLLCCTYLYLCTATVNPKYRVLTGRCRGRSVIRPLKIQKKRQGLRNSYS